MNAGRLAADPLWQCLCPAWTTIRATGATRSLIPAGTPASQLQRKPFSTKRAFSSTPHKNAARQPYNNVIHPLRKYPPELLRNAAKKPHRPYLPRPKPPPDYNLEPTPALYTHLRAAAIDGRVRESRRLAELIVRERGERPSLQLYHSLILCNVDFSEGAAWRVAELLEEMSAAGIVLDGGICHAVLKVLAVHPDHLLRSDILAYMRERWFVLSDDGAHDVAAGLFREGLLEQGLQQLDSMRGEGIRINAWLLDMAIYVLCDVGEVTEAHRIMASRMGADEHVISRSVWWCLLDHASDGRHYEATRFVWMTQVALGYLNPSSGMCLNVLATAAQAGDLKLARDVVNHLKSHGVRIRSVHYELLTNASLAADPPDLRSALEVLSTMAKNRMSPGPAETRTLYTYLHDKRELVDKAIIILRELHSEGQTIPLASLNLLIECYIELDDLNEAIRVYKQIHTFVPLAEGIKKSFADAETFNILLKGCRTHDPPDARTAMFLVTELLALGVAPNQLTYDRLILVLVEAAASSDSSTTTTTTASKSAMSFSNDDIILDIEDEHSRTRSPADLLNLAYGYFTEMHARGGSLPRTGTMRLLAVALAQKGDPRCWEILQAAEDGGERVPGWRSKARFVRADVDAAWTAAMAAAGIVPGEQQGGGGGGGESSDVATFGI